NQKPEQTTTQSASPHTSFEKIGAKETTHSSSIPFNKNYTFDTFVVGTSNEIAHAACRAVAARPGEAYNPLFIYGGVGLGKTHLLQAVGNAIQEANPNFTVLYVASEKFTNEFVDSLKHHTTAEFKKRYRNIDVLIIDDIQFFAGKDKTQEELFYTFNSLHGQNKQLILSSDRPPSAISTLQERLLSRLSAGMVADVKKPDYETRLAILEEKRDLQHVPIDQDALSFIAKNIQSNVRELEGALNRVAAYCDLHKTRATIEYTKQILKDILEKPQRKTINIDEIITAVSSYYNIPNVELKGKSRKKEIVRPRQIAMYLLRKESSMSFPSIGDHFSGRDHTTAMHACEKIERLIEQDEELSQEISFLRERIYA
ncbi:MAG: chromosomal replication initiator protein DnaA, partial [Patescibacteria group bacterium]